MNKSIITALLWFLSSSLTVLFSALEVSGRTLKSDLHTLNSHTSKSFEEIGVAIASSSSSAPIEQSSGYTDRNLDGEQTTRIRHHQDQGENLNISFQANRLLVEVPGTNELELLANSIAQAVESPPVEATQTPQETPPVTPVGEPNSSAAAQPNLAQQSQNPIANLISVPLQLNTNFGVGEFDRTSVVFNIQPVIPTSISADWVLINRFIVPLAYQPELARIPLPSGETQSIGDVFGLGDIAYQSFFSPKNSGSFTWGIGPILGFPTATDELLGTGQ